ncbi:MAG: DmsC/YnfH family molybdoenzyme membrane anchor subunit [Vibrio sp.]
MAWHELPLIIFTVFAQTSVGAFVILGLAVLSGQMNEAQHKRMLQGMFFMLALMGLGFMASTMHLGSPLRMFNSLNRVGASWLSNEILTCSVFFGFAGLYWLGALTGKVSASVQKLLLVLGMLAGLIAMYAMTHVYLINTVPTWNNGFTPLAFALTVIISGFAFASVILAYALDKPWPITNYLPRVGAVFALVSVLVSVNLVMALPEMKSAIQVASDIIPNLNRLLTWRYLVLFAGIACWMMGAKRQNQLALLACGSLLIIVSELMGRGVFYGLHMTAGM